MLDIYDRLGQVVRIVPAHVQAAITEAGDTGVSQAQLAKAVAERLGEKSKPIEGMLSEVSAHNQQKLRARVLAELAAEVNLPETWFCNPPTPLPFVSYDPEPTPSTVIPPVELRLHRFGTKVRAAVRRDLKAAGGGASEVDRRNREVGLYIAVHELTEPQSWKHWLLNGWDPREEAKPGWQDREQGATIALVDALEHILEPWFAGRAELSRNLIAFVGAASAPIPSKHPPRRKRR